MAKPFSAWQMVAEDGSETLVSVVAQEIHGIREMFFVRLKGLIPGAYYIDTKTGTRYSADCLMQAGFPLPEMKGENIAYQLHLKIC